MYDVVKLQLSPLLFLVSFSSLQYNYLMRFHFKPEFLRLKRLRVGKEDFDSLKVIARLLLLSVYCFSIKKAAVDLLQNVQENFLAWGP